MKDCPSSYPFKKIGFFRAKFWRSLFWQLFIVVIIVYGLQWLVNNTIDNLTRAKITSGFGFLDMRAGISIPDSLIAYNPDSTYLQALLAGLVNTIVMAILSIFTATIIGFFIGLGRLSHNWLLRQFCTVYVELFRNIPPLLVIFFWYFGVLTVLPDANNSLSFGKWLYINKKGFYFAAPLWDANSCFVFWVFLGGLLLSVVYGFYCRRRQPHFLRWPVYLLLVLIVPLAMLIFWVPPTGFDYPVKGFFNFSGGKAVYPEFLALFLALSLYTGALIAETIRSGLLGVPKGYIEAASALGFKTRQRIRLIVVPLAMRIIIPPLASQYMNLIKNTSLGVAIGYSELMRVSNTIFIQTNQSIEVVVIWLVVYLGLSLIVSLLMNWFNRKMALVEK